MPSYRFEKIVLLSDRDSIGLTEKIYSKLIAYSRTAGKIPGRLREFNPEELEIRVANNNEIIPNIKTTVRGRHVYVIKSSTVNQIYEPNTSLMEAFIIADACIQASADRVTLVAPHLPYQRQDRRSTDKITGAEKREPLSAKLTLRLLKESGYSGLITVDPHFDQYRSALPNDFQLETPTARIAIANHIIKSGLLEKKVTVISPDYGGGKRAEILAKDLGITYGGLCRKQREKPGIIGNMTVLPEEGITLSEYDFALILDDIIDSGGTLEKCYQALKAKEVKDIIVAAPHGIFTKGAQHKLLDTGIKLITTNAIPQVYDPRIEVIDLSTILAVTIHCIATGHGSISRKLFNINEYRALEEKLSR